MSLSVSRPSYCFFALILVYLAIGGCATLPETVDRTAMEQRRFKDREVEIDSHQDWTLNGRVAIKAEDEGWNARIRWVQRGENFDIRVIAPFGRGTFKISGAPGQVALTDPDGEVYSADAPEALMQSQLGWSLPLQGLRYWVRGITEPSGAIAQLNLDPDARLRDLQQSGWRVSILDYRPVDTVELPARLFMLSDRLEVRLAIENWALSL
jgi:outer membrane lipoprotein LolB